MPINAEGYYFKALYELERLTSIGQEITRKDIDTIIRKYYGTKETSRVIKRLKDLGYITHEKKEIIKLVKK
jgi:Mn-dependent DtxR family transcriptional regulator